MKERLIEWLGLNQPETEETVDVRHAAAALMVEVMAADHHWDDQEEGRIKKLLKSELGVADDEAREIFSLAQHHQQEAHDLYQFTSVVNDHYDNDQKFTLLKQLWKVAYADGQVDRYEEHMIRKLADLLHMAHSLFIQAKIEAREERGTPQ